MDYAGIVSTGSTKARRALHRVVRGWLVVSVLVCLVAMRCSVSAAAVAEAAGANVAIDDSLTARVTVSLSNVRFEQALQAVAAVGGASVSWDGSAWLVLANRPRYIAQPSGPDQSTVQVIDVSNMEYLSAIDLVRAVAGDLRVEPFPELRAIVISGRYAQVNSAKAALDGYLRSSSGVASDERALRIIRLSYVDPSEVSMAMQGQVPSVRISPLRAANAVILNGPRPDVESVANAIKELDCAPALVAFDVEILEVDSEDLQAWGVDWTNAQGYPMFSLALKENEPRPGLRWKSQCSCVCWRDPGR